MDKLISIIVPSYNAAEFINNTAKSVLKQTYTNWECIFVNDGSTDNTEDLLKEWCIKETRFSMFSQNNQGLSATRNFGMSVAKGDYIYFLDADDVLPSNALTDISKSMHEDSDFCIGLISIVDIKTNNILGKLHHFQNQITYIDNQNKELIVQIVNEGHACVAQNKLYKVSFLKQNNIIFKTNILHEDEIWFFETMFLAQKVSFCWKSTYHYHINNANSITNNRSDKNILDTIKILNILYHKYYLNDQFKNYQEIIGLYIIHFKKTIYEALNISLKNISSKTIQEVELIFKNIQIYRYTTLLSREREKFYFNFIKISFLSIDKINLYYKILNSTARVDRLTKFLLKNFAFLSNYKIIKKYYQHIK